MNEPSNGGRGGNGRGSGGDSVDDFADPDDDTVVIVSDEYARQSIRRLVGVLRSAADRGERLGDLGEETAAIEEAVLILGEMQDEMAEVSVLANGTERALGRIERQLLQKAARQREAEGTT